MAENNLKSQSSYCLSKRYPILTFANLLNITEFIYFSVIIYFVSQLITFSIQIFRKQELVYFLLIAMNKFLNC